MFIRSQRIKQFKEIARKSIKIDLKAYRYRKVTVDAPLPPPAILSRRQWYQSTPDTKAITAMPLAGAAVTGIRRSHSVRRKP